MPEYILEVRNVSKSFPGVKALDDVSLAISPGEICAFVGENGAGKSTLMKILNGNYKKDSGTIIMDGEEINITSPIHAKELGISIVFQELNLVPLLSVAENMFMGRLKDKGRMRIDWRQIHRQAKRLLDQIGASIDTHALVDTLSIAEKQLVEIAKALSYSNTRLILMDEPSATLTRNELDKLFDVIRELKRKDVAVIYISHRLEEIFEICERVTVLRDGKIIDSCQICETDENAITAKMIGREITNKFPKRENVKIGKEILRVEHLSAKGVLNDISFSLHEGEVLGIAGLVGAGRTEMARALFGIDYCDSKTVIVNGEVVKIDNPSASIKKGIAYLSEDRKKEGLIGNSTVKFNLTKVNLRSVMKYGMLNAKKERIVAQDLVQKLNIKTPHLNQNVMNLSGGNQQKIVVGKWLNTKANIFVFDEPTRGIDVGSKYEIFVLINELASKGNGVILISSELTEVLNMSDKVLVMSKGSIRAELSGDEITAENFIKNAI